MSDWVGELARLTREGTAAVVVTVASSRGSAPRGAGTRMIVTPERVRGTIGGGHLEHQAIAIARGFIASGGSGELRRFPLGARLGQCCGGIVNLLFEPVTGPAEWIEALAAAHDRGEDAVVVTVAENDAAPGRLVVTRDTVRGSLGDIDEEAVARAREMLASGDSARLAAMGVERRSRDSGNPASLPQTTLGPRFRGDDRQAGTSRTVFLDPVRATDFRIVLFGAGHVGRALVQVLSGLSCRITWVDGRSEEFPRGVPANVTIACTDVPTAEVRAAAPGSCFLVMTHSHALDEELAEAILARDDFAYFGLIGSLTKRRAFERRMANRGVPAERFRNMTCPIGIAGIRNKEPTAIAIAVAAELLQMRERCAAGRAVPAEAQRA